MIHLPYFGSAIIKSCSSGDVGPDWTWRTYDREEWNGLVLWAIAGGQANFVTGQGQSFRVSRGDVLLLRNDRARVGTTKPEDPLKVPWCFFDWEDPADRAYWQQHGPDIFLRRATDPGFMINCVRRIIDEQLMGHQQGAKIYLQAALAEFASAPRYGNGTSDEWGHRIRAVCRSMQEHPEEDWSLNTLAADHRCDPDHFARVFRREVGESPGRYVIRCRIDRARHLLMHTKKTVAEVAELLGYHDQFYFSKQFKKNVGVSPRSFRQQPPR